MHGILGYHKSQMLLLSLVILRERNIDILFL